jgi:hypothetical protein
MVKRADKLRHLIADIIFKKKKNGIIYEAGGIVATRNRTA